MKHTANSKNSGIDMTAEEVLPALLAFSIPTVIGNLLHQVYSITDSIVVGRILGVQSLAAIGSTMPIVLLLAALVIGVNIGVSILLSQAFGMHDMPLMRRSFANSLYLGAALSVLIGVVGLFTARPILLLMGTPPGPLEEAVAYLRINFLTTLCPMLYYLHSCAYRGLGDSRTDLYCLIVSVASNIALDVLFVAVFHWGVAGTAWATALAQLMSAIFAALLLWKKYPEMRLTREDARLDPRILRRIGALAVPIALQTAFNNLGSLVAQAAVNLFGTVAMAAYTAAGRVGTLALVPLEAMGSSISVFTGQNYGAGKHARIREGLRIGLLMELVVAVFLGALLLFFGRAVTTLFLTDASSELLSMANSYLLITAVPSFLAAIMIVYQQTLRGVGRTRDSMVGGVIQLAVKVLIIVIGAYALRSMPVMWLGWPLSFAAAALYLVRCWKRYDKTDPTEKGNEV